MNAFDNSPEQVSEMPAVPGEQMRAPRVNRSQQDGDVFRDQTNGVRQSRVACRFVDNLDGAYESVQACPLVGLFEVPLSFHNCERGGYQEDAIKSPKRKCW